MCAVLVWLVPPSRVVPPRLTTGGTQQQEQLRVFAWGAGAVPIIQKHLTHFTSK